MKIKNPKRGQILVITLIIMFILSLVSLSAAIGINRETQQRVYNEVYEQNYSLAENRLLQAAEFIKGLGGIASSDLTDFQLSFDKFSDLSTNFESTCSETELSEFECVIVEDCNETTVNLSNGGAIDSIPLRTADAYHIDLVNAAGALNTNNLQFSWTEDVTWSISLITKRQYGTNLNNYEYEVIKGQYDGPNVTSDTKFPYSAKTSNSFTLGSIKNLLGHTAPVSYIPTSKIGKEQCGVVTSTSIGFRSFRRIADDGYVATIGSGYLPNGQWRVSSITSGGNTYSPGVQVNQTSIIDNALVLRRGPSGNKFGLLHRYDGFGIYNGSVYNGEPIYGYVTLEIYEDDDNSGTRSAGGTVNFSFIPGTCPVEVPAFLRIRPIITNGASVTNLTITGAGNLTSQSLELSAQSKNICLNDTSPTPLLSLNLPLNSAPPAIFDYVFYEK